MSGGGHSDADGVGLRYSMVKTRLDVLEDLFEVADVCVQVLQRVGVLDVMTPWTP